MLTIDLRAKQYPPRVDLLAEELCFFWRRAGNIAVIFLPDSRSITNRSCCGCMIAYDGVKQRTDNNRPSSIETSDVKFTLRITV